MVVLSAQKNTNNEQIATQLAIKILHKSVLLDPAGEATLLETKGGGVQSAQIRGGVTCLDNALCSAFCVFCVFCVNMGHDSIPPLRHKCNTMDAERHQKI